MMENSDFREKWMLGAERLQLTIRPYSNECFDNFLSLQYEIAPSFRKVEDDLVRSTIGSLLRFSDVEYYSVFDSNGVYCGNIELHLSKGDEFPEIGIAILKERQNLGIGSEAIRQFCDYCYREKHFYKLAARIDPQNARSIHIVEKIGAVAIGRENNPVLEQIISESNSSVDAEKLGVSVLTYHIQLPLPL